MTGGTVTKTLWFPRIVSREAPEVRLLCLGGAGTGPAEFAAWPAGLPDRIEVWAAQLPGRERRIREAPAASLAALADPLAEELERAGGTTPWAIFGHSFGCLVGYEVARRLAGEGPLAGMVVASAVVPHLQSGRLPVESDDDETLLAWARRADGTATSFLDDERFARWLAEDLRVTLRIRREYPVVAPAPLPCPILAVGGTDDPDVTPADLAHWRDYTTVSFAQREIGRGHFFLRDTREGLLAAVTDHLDLWSGRSSR